MIVDSGKEGLPESHEDAGSDAQRGIRHPILFQN